MTEPRRHVTNPLFPWPPEDEKEDPKYYCPHGVEVATPGGACDLCVAEEEDAEWEDAFAWGFVADDE